MLRLAIACVVGIAVSAGVEAQAGNAPQSAEYQPVRAEKPWPFSRRDSGDDVPRDRLQFSAKSTSQRPTELYLRVKKFYDEGGQQWIEVGVENTIDNAIEHLIEEHQFTRKQLLGYDLITLNWIHGMAHEWGNPESSEELPLRAER